MGWGMAMPMRSLRIPLPRAALKRCCCPGFPNCPVADQATGSGKTCSLRGILPIIPPRSNRKAPVHPDYRRYKDRNRIERMSGKLKQRRRIATRYDKQSCRSKASSTSPPQAYG